MAGLFCCKSRVLKVHAGQPSHYRVVTEESFLTSNSLQVMVCTAGGCAAGVMPLQSTARKINPPLRTRLTDDFSYARLSATGSTSADRPCLPRPSFLQGETRRPAREVQANRPSRRSAEIALTQPCKIDFRYAARATQLARAPASVPPRGCLPCLRCAHLTQDGRAVPRRRTPQWPPGGRLPSRRGAGRHRRCGWSQTLTPTTISSFSAVSARPPAGFVALEIAGRSEGGRTVGWRCAV